MLKLNFKKLGQGPPLIVLHGLFGSLDNWSTLGRKLGEHYTVYLVDARNHGRSPHQAPFTYSAMAEDIKALIQAEKTGPVWLVGHSMGGKTAMMLALQEPDLVRGLAVVDMSPKASKVNFGFIISALQAVDMDRLQRREDAETVLAADIDEVGIRQFLLKNLYRKENGAFAWRFNLPLIANQIAEIGQPMPEKVYEGPVVFIRGGNSDYVPDDHLEEIKSRFPQGEIKTVAGAGHWVHAEKPKEFLDALLAFLPSA